MQAFLDELKAASIPLINAGKPFSSLGDLHDFVAQDRPTGELMRDNILAAKEYGLARTAIVSAPAMVKLQYRRLSEGQEFEFFDSKAEALAWLRGSA